MKPQIIIAIFFLALTLAACGPKYEVNHCSTGIVEIDGWLDAIFIDWDFNHDYSGTEELLSAFEKRYLTPGGIDEVKPITTCDAAYLEAVEELYNAFKGGDRLEIDREWNDVIDFDLSLNHTGG